MLAITPDAIEVHDAGSSIVENPDFPGDPLKANVNQKWAMTVPQQGGTAYYRLPDEVVKFFELCNEKHTILGFEWDPESPRNFGIVLKEEAKPDENKG